MEFAPLVSCLCVTEGRAAFMPWLLWCFDRQRWPHRELVVVDSSPQPLQLADRADVRVVAAPTRTSVAAKRNLALGAARGEVVAWFDDDDWQHPDRLACLVAALGSGAPYAGSRQSWFVDLAQATCEPYRGWRDHIIFNSAGFRREAVLPLRFPEHVQRASDTRWMQQVAALPGGPPAVIARDDLFFWLCHERNLSNPAASRRCAQPLAALRQAVGPEAWADTDEALAALRDRLRDEPARRSAPPAPDTPHADPPPYLIRDDDPAPGPEPAVSLMIKATVLDAPYLDALARHMIAQARFPFAERVIVVDTPARFSGKYQGRPRASRAALDRVLGRLLDDGTVDRVCEVDTTPAVVGEVLERYFGPAAPRVPTHAVTGGPIYATLYGLEALDTDHVLQLDADVFFFGGATSWVREALQCMRRDPRMWLMMTHPGPPAGPPGRSLGAANLQRARWDPALGIYRFQTATTRYFLCNRENLRRNLRPIAVQGGCAPLEQCISLALRQHGAFRGSLGGLTSWHLHGWYHGDPFPEWAGPLAAAVAAGRYPPRQAGSYDLRLDRPPDRAAWRELLDRDAPPAAVAGITSAEPAGVPPSPAAAGSQAPLAVVIPIRDRAGLRLHNALRSLRWQAPGCPAQTIVVSCGSRPEIDRELAQICAAEGAELLAVGDPSRPWNKPFALNCGIRCVRPEIPFVMCMDADMILAPNFLEVVVGRLQRTPPALVLCRSSDLPADARLPTQPDQLLHDFERLRAAARMRSRTGTGGIQAAPRAFFFEIRGYDEDLVWWGAMDGDIVNRAQLMRLAVEWVEDRTAMLHQWHARKDAGLSRREDIEQARRAWQRNHELVRARAHLAQRNPNGWGETVSS